MPPSKVGGRRRTADRLLRSRASRTQTCGPAPSVHLPRDPGWPNNDVRNSHVRINVRYSREWLDRLVRVWGYLGGGCHARRRPTPTRQQWVFGPLRRLAPARHHRPSRRTRDRDGGVDRPRHGHRNGALREGRRGRRSEACIRRRSRRRRPCPTGRGTPPGPSTRRRPCCGGFLPGHVPGPGCERVGAAVPDGVLRARRSLPRRQAADSVVGDARPARRRWPDGAARSRIGAPAGPRRRPPGRRRTTPRPMAAGRRRRTAAGDRVLGPVRHRPGLCPPRRAHPDARRPPCHSGRSDQRRPLRRPGPAQDRGRAGRGPAAAAHRPAAPGLR